MQHKQTSNERKHFAYSPASARNQTVFSLFIYYPIPMLASFYLQFILEFRAALLIMSIIDLLTAFQDKKRNSIKCNGKDIMGRENEQNHVS
jgi:hypothetical protein